MKDEKIQCTIRGIPNDLSLDENPEIQQAVLKAIAYYETQKIKPMCMADIFSLALLYMMEKRTISCQLKS